MLEHGIRTHCDRGVIDSLSLVFRHLRGVPIGIFRYGFTVTRTPVSDHVLPYEVPGVKHLSTEYGRLYFALL